MPTEVPDQSEFEDLEQRVETLESDISDKIDADDVSNKVEQQDIDYAVSEMRDELMNEIARLREEVEELRGQVVSCAAANL